MKHFVHFRPTLVLRKDCVFICGENALSIKSKYTYLGLVLNEFLDYNITAKVVAEAERRDLGLVIS